MSKLFEALRHSIHARRVKAPKAVVEDLFDQFDTDKSGSLEFKELDKVPYKEVVM